MRKALLIACALLLWGGMAAAQDLIRYYPPQSNSAGNGFTGTSGGAQLQWDAANTLAQRNGGTQGTPVPQLFRVYDFCDGVDCATGYRRLQLGYVGTIFRIDNQNGGTGATSYFTFTYNGGGGYAFTETNFNPANDAIDLGQNGAFWKSFFVGRSIQGSKSKALTDNTATTFATVAMPQAAGSNYGGGQIIYTIFCKDASNQAQQTGTVKFVCMNLAGTESCGWGTPDGVTLGDGTASLGTPTFTAAAGADLVTMSEIGRAHV